MGYSRAVKVSILRRVLPPNNESIAKVSEEIGLNDQTIRNWVKAASEGQLLSEETSPRFINAQEKYLLIKEAASISEADKGTFLRERGLHSEHLTLWDQELREMMNQKQDLKNQEVQALKKRVIQLEKELHRKEKALAEATALLMLKKKFENVMMENEDDRSPKNTRLC
jgi:transposase-like protein